MVVAGVGRSGGEGVAAPERRMARSSVPRYDATTRGSLRTWSGGPSAMIVPGLEAVDAVADRHDEGHVVLDDQQRRAELGLDPGDERTERLGLALGHAGGGLVEADDPGLEREDAGQLADAAGAGGQRADEVVGEGAEAEVVDELVGPGQLLAVAASPGREPGRAPRACGSAAPARGPGPRSRAR